MELGITPKEAQVFWPVYNQVEKERDEAVRLVFQSFMEMEKKEVSKLLDAYLDALEKQGDLESKAAEKYAKVLPMEKVAKLYVGEEKFRRQQIRRLHPNPMQR